MIHTALIWNEIVACIPCFSALTWFAILLIARYDSYTLSERNIKHTLLWFYGFATFMWFSFFVYHYRPAGFVYLNSFLYAAALLMIVCYYRYIHQLTSPDICQNISVWHYLVAVLAPGALLIWSFFVPLEVQEALVTGRGQWVAGYEAYSMLFLSKPFVLFVYGAVYTVAATRRLLAYYAEARKKEDTPIRLTHWVLLLMGIAVTLLLFVLFILLTPRSRLASMGGVAVLIGLSCVQHLVLGYNVICRNFLLYLVKEEEEAPEAPQPEGRQPDTPQPDDSGPYSAEPSEPLQLSKRTYTRTSEVSLSPQGKLVSAPLTQKRLEGYMRDSKPYLNPKLKITDLVTPLKTNRTAISNFVNQTYGVNFNGYVNHLRLKELERLQQQASNAHLEVSQLITMAGFADMRHYRRALEMQQAQAGRSTTPIQSPNPKT